MISNITILASVALPRERTRIEKLFKSTQHRYNLKFVGWNRENEQYQTSFRSKHEVIHLLRGGGYANKYLLFYYPLWFLKVFLFGIRQPRSNLYCLAFDTAFPIALASLFRSHNFIFDHADNFSKSYSWPYPIKKILEKLEVFTAHQASIHLIPSKARWDSGSAENCHIIPNIPTTDAMTKAKQISSTLPKRGRNKRLTLYVNGRLIHSRGIDILTNLLDILPDKYLNQLEIILAGNIISPEAEKLSQTKPVHYLGLLDNEEALAWYYRSDIAFTFYDPAIEINRLAQPNKWGDCIATSTPFIVNDEVLSAKPYKDRGACFSVPYNNLTALRNLVVDLIDNTEKIESVSNALTEHFTFIAWDKQINLLLEEWIKPSS